MKFKTLLIKNFRSFSPDNKSPIVFRDITVLFGANNSGKSNILEAINLVFSDRLKYEVKSLTHEDYFDPTLPIFLRVAFDGVNRDDGKKIGFTKAQQTNILGGKETRKRKVDQKIMVAKKRAYLETLWSRNI